MNISNVKIYFKAIICQKAWADILFNYNYLFIIIINW